MAEHDPIEMMLNILSASRDPRVAPRGELPEDYAEELGDVMSNFDHVIEPWAEERLKAGPCYGQYAAWNFFGEVWWDPAEKVFCCDVKRYRQHVATVRGATLQDVMDQCSAQWGSD